MKIIIPARAGSKRIPNKNIVDLAGQPLISYVIQTSLKITQDVYVSTDSSKIKKIAKRYGAKHIQRPPELATDISSTNSVIRHFLEVVDGVDHFACVQPTTPLLAPSYLRKGFDKIQEKSFNSVISVTKNTSFFWDEGGKPVNFEKNERPRTQDMRGWYTENGAFYITTKNNFLKTNNLVNGNVGFIMMPQMMSFEIDTYEDLELVNVLCTMQNQMACKRWA